MEESTVLNCVNQGLVLNQQDTFESGRKGQKLLNCLKCFLLFSIPFVGTILFYNTFSIKVQGLPDSNEPV